MDAAWYVTIYPCINDENDQALLQRLRDAKKM